MTLDGGGHAERARTRGRTERRVRAASRWRWPANCNCRRLTWQGRITQLMAKDTPAGAWNLEKAVAVQASAEKPVSTTPVWPAAPEPALFAGSMERRARFQRPCAAPRAAAGTLQAVPATGHEPDDPH